MERIFRSSWQVPFGEISLKLDSLSLIFLIAVAILVLCAGIYGFGYMRRYHGQRFLFPHILFYLLFVGALFFIVLADNVIIFLSAWEVMTVSTFFLILFHDESAPVRKAGFIYLIASHCATFFLFLMFFLLSRASGSMSFSVMAGSVFSPLSAGSIFLLALVGFGVKAGFLPVHIWLPHAHPAAPSHVSALLSGIAIKMGIYGICRVLWILGALPDWCGYILLVIGMTSGVAGVLYALGQHELKKLLAYHSIENIGIIALGLGVGSLGLTYHLPSLAVIGFGGALLHVFNHSLFKGLLFLCAGSVIQQTHTGDIDKLGGLAKSLPVTSSLFLVGAMSICGLPLFNGFISEFIIYFGLFQGLFSLPLPGIIFCCFAILSLVLMGVLALACFAKVYGVVFLGRARSVLPDNCRSATGKERTSKWMLGPMLILAALCVWIGIFPRAMTTAACSAGSYLARINLATDALPQLLISFTSLVSTALIFVAIFSGLILVRRFLQGSGSMPLTETWNCGFSRVSSKFQYTSSSFARPILELAKSILCFRRSGGEVTGFFPARTHLAASVNDASEEMFFRPVLNQLTDWSKKIDNNRVLYTQAYLMYIFLFLIFLLVWKFR